MKNRFLIASLLVFLTTQCLGQHKVNADSVRAKRARMVKSATKTYGLKKFTHADTLRGSITPQRAWWDVQRYDLTIQPDYNKRSTAGHNRITYKVVGKDQPAMQIDLRSPLIIDSVLDTQGKQLALQQEEDQWYIQQPFQQMGTIAHVDIYFHGQPIISTNPPWKGGWTFTQDSLGRPWMTVCCQGDGASLWYPCKDHQSDEPDLGASLTMTTSDTLEAVSNGHRVFRKDIGDGTTTTKWEVQSPISNYCLIPYIGKYAHFHQVFPGENGPLDMDYWVLDYHLDKAKQYMPAQATNMLKSMEYWFGPYPFYKDGYKLVEVEHTGMEHQSAVAYGNHYAYGYRGRDLAGNGWGKKWDFIIIHESGHEWFGNNITSKDLADMWVHESFTNYSETLFVEYMWGTQAGNAYNVGIRKNIVNDRPIIPHYGVNQSGRGDMYYKGSNMLQAIRHSMDDDGLFRQILRGLNQHFYHQTVTGQQIQDYISQKAGYDYHPVFDQYLKTTQVPKLILQFNRDSSVIRYKWASCRPDFNLPLVLKSDNSQIKVYPATYWQTRALLKSQITLFDQKDIQQNYYIHTQITPWNK